MNRRVTIALAALALALVAAAAFFWLGVRDETALGPGGEAEEAAGRPAAFDLYFPDEAGELVPEERELAVSADAEGRARAVVLAILDGPRGPSLHRPFPEETVLLDLYLDAEGTVYVDLGQEGAEEPPASGSLAEMLRVYSVVDSLAYNLQEVERVALLWNGVQRETFSGHLDTSVPLVPREEIVAAAHRERRPRG